jgi:hypothetical protein
MRRISVTSQGRGVIGEISLDGPISALVWSDMERPWGRRLHLISREEDLLEVRGLDPHEDLRPVLTDLQNGLLYAETAGLRLVRTPDRARLLSLSDHCGRADLLGSGGRTAILAFWDRDRESREAAELASRQRHAAFTLTRASGRAKHRTLLSVLVPERYADLTLEEITLFQIARARPLIISEPEPERNPPKPVLAGKEAPPPEPPAGDWTGPGPDRFPDPRLEIDQIAFTVCGLIGSGQVRAENRVRGSIQAGLIDCWRLGSGRSATRPEVAPYLREIARVIEMTIRKGGGLEGLTALRGLLRAFGLVAWGIGLVRAATRGGEAPPSRFAEECSTAMREVPIGSRDYLIDLYRGETDQPHGSEAIEDLTSRGLLDRSRVLTGQGRAVVEAELAWADTDRPPILSLLEPGTDFWEGVPLPPLTEEGAGRERARDEAEIDPFLEHLVGLDMGPTAPDGTDPFHATTLSVLETIFRVGRDGARALHRSGRVRPPHALALADRARVIAEVTREDRLKGGTDRARALIRACAPEIWRLGLADRGGETGPPETRFREECSVPMRPVPLRCRWALMALYQGGLTAPLPTGVRGQLKRAGLLIGGKRPRLTEDGSAIARAELSVAEAGLPSILSLIGEDPPKTAGPRWPAPPAEIRAKPAPEADPTPPPDPLEADTHRPDETVRARIRDVAADDCARFRPGPRSDDLFRALITGTLMLCWRMGYDPEGTGQERQPSRIADLIRERSGVIERLTRSERRSGEMRPTEALLVGCGVEMWRYGAIMRDAPDAPLPARYREECSEPMRPVPFEARDRLLSLLERRSGRPMRATLLREVVKARLIKRDGLTLTRKGELVARTERGHRGRDLPSIRSLDPAWRGAD